MSEIEELKTKFESMNRKFETRFLVILASLLLVIWKLIPGSIFAIVGILVAILALVSIGYDIYKSYGLREWVKRKTNKSEVN
jgi:hypothetical protein